MKKHKTLRRIFGTLLLFFLGISLHAQNAQKIFVVTLDTIINDPSLNEVSAICEFRSSVGGLNITTQNGETAIYDANAQQYILTVPYLGFNAGGCKRQLKVNNQPIAPPNSMKGYGNAFPFKSGCRYRFVISQISKTALMRAELTGEKPSAFLTGKSWLRDPNIKVAFIEVKHWQDNLKVKKPAKNPSLVYRILTDPDTLKREEEVHYTYIIVNLRGLRYLQKNMSDEAQEDSATVTLEFDGCVPQTINIPQLIKLNPNNSVDDEIELFNYYRYKYEMVVLEGKGPEPPLPPEGQKTGKGKTEEGKPAKVKVDKGGFAFMEACFSASPHPFWSAGLTVGGMRKVGGYVSLMSDFQFKGMSTPMEEGGTYDLTGRSKSVRFSATAGLMVKVTDKFALHAGAGFGYFAKTFETKTDGWYRLPSSTLLGADVALGGDIFIKKAALSFEFVTTNFKTIEFKIGVGFNTRKKQ